MTIKTIDDTETIIYAILPRKSYFARKLAISSRRKIKNTISSSNGKGRHTTTTSQLLQHNSLCTVIYTPSVRELQYFQKALKISIL